MNGTVILLIAMAVMAVLMLVVGTIGNKIIAALTPKSRNERGSQRRDQ